MFELLKWYLEKLFGLSAEKYSITIVYSCPELTYEPRHDGTMTALEDMYDDIDAEFYNALGLSSPPLYNICTRLTPFRSAARKPTILMSPIRLGWLMRVWKQIMRPS